MLFDERETSASPPEGLDFNQKGWDFKTGPGKGPADISDEKYPHYITARVNFTTALEDFTLAHAELISFYVSLLVQKSSRRAADLAAAIEGMSAIAKHIEGVY